MAVKSCRSKRCFVIRMKGSEWLFLIMTEKAMEYELLKDCRGVSFTPDILSRLGFKKEWLDEGNRGEGSYFTLALSNNKRCDLSFISGDKNGIMEVCIFPYTDDFRVQYVHELQNWYSALKREPLLFNHK